MKNVLKTIKNIIGTLLIFLIFFIVLIYNIEQSGYVFPYTIFKALGWTALSYRIYFVVGFAYFFIADRSLRKSEDKEEKPTNYEDSVAFVAALILMLIGGVFLNICY